ncbi:hypothetical protein GGTG_09216 [Gaeumannomyces tritici R3-111a-1]|uniref:Uncharacterized protein n=1 Tax=Gaeumannomyces tritici (strain R3-111a-1) TaxID=644352 RepID=J3P6S4_GAET3|nr:hypothetical protein GGTG_09216 [Gaeumannomyces tritici R3-111a-1]EJT72350.1 hypothetical protein GGTG_09216 [Gaeumannomyces tritici R3-111a-1]
MRWFASHLGLAAKGDIHGRRRWKTADKSEHQIDEWFTCSRPEENSRSAGRIQKQVGRPVWTYGGPVCRRRKECMLVDQGSEKSVDEAEEIKDKTKLTKQSRKIASITQTIVDGVTDYPSNPQAMLAGRFVNCRLMVGVFRVPGRI